MGPHRTNDDKTFFGFTKVDWDQKSSLVKDVFEGVASQYDLMNDVMSLGIHRIWKAEFIGQIVLRPNAQILDVAGGTGDIALKILEKARSVPIKVTVCDINEKMMEVGRDRAIDRGVTQGVEWMCGDAANLPVAADAIDIYTIAFGLRNVTDIKAALKEAVRVLKPGGHFLCLEFSHVENASLRSLYEMYSFKIIPRLGQFIARNKGAYQYLVESIAQFPNQETLKGMMEEAGFKYASYTNLSGGIAAIHQGWKE